MGIREALRGRVGVREEDIDDIIEIAARLQDERTEGQDSARRMDALRRTAAELDIDPALIDGAVTQFQEERARQAQEAAQQAAQTAWRRRMVAIVMAIVLLVSTLAGAGGAAIGASSVSAAGAEASQAQARLELVMDRQAALAPQLVALAGGNQQALQEAVSDYQNAETFSDKQAAAEDLNQAMATALASLPPATDDASTQVRLNLQYELTGSQNRVTTEGARYTQAQQAWNQAAQTPTGRLAIAVGLADAPQ